MIPVDLQENLEEILPKLLAENIRCFYLGHSSPTPGVEALGAALDAAPSDPVPANLPAKIKWTSPAIFIYTSGTTGEDACGHAPTRHTLILTPLTLHPSISLSSDTQLCPRSGPLPLTLTARVALFCFDLLLPALKTNQRVGLGAVHM